MCHPSIYTTLLFLWCFETEYNKAPLGLELTETENDPLGHIWKVWASDPVWSLPPHFRQGWGWGTGALLCKVCPVPAFLWAECET